MNIDKMIEKLDEFQKAHPWASVYTEIRAIIEAGRDWKDHVDSKILQKHSDRLDALEKRVDTLWTQVQVLVNSMPDDQSVPAPAECVHSRVAYSLVSGIKVWTCSDCYASWINECDKPTAPSGEKEKPLWKMLNELDDPSPSEDKIYLDRKVTQNYVDVLEYLVITLRKALGR